MFCVLRHVAAIAATTFRVVSKKSIQTTARTALIVSFSLGLAKLDRHWQAHAHTNTVGYVVSSGNTLTVYYGTYHSSTSGPEGTITITNASTGVSIPQAAGAVTSTKPAGLTDNVNNFRATSCGGLDQNQTVQNWQSATFSNVPSGTYSITLTGSFSQVWEPCSSEMSSPSSTFTFDTVLPTLSGMPANIVQDTDAGLATATVTWTPPTATDDVGIQSVTSTHAPGDAFPLGTTTVSYTATDTSGGTTTESFTVTVNDNEDPIVTTPADRTIEATSAAGAIDTFTPTTTDNVAVTNSTSSPASGTQFPLGATTVTVTAEDAAGNTGTGTFTVTVVDTTTPALTQANITTTTDPGAATAAVNYTMTATDSVGVEATNFSPPSGSSFPVGTTTVTATATDAAGNVGTTTFTVTVADEEAPVITAPANITVNTDNNAATATVGYTVTATDNVDGTVAPTLTAGLPAGATFPIGTTTITYQATDTVGNTSTNTFTVTVVDNQPPTNTSVPSTISQSAASGSDTAAIAYDIPTFNDNSGTVSVVRTAGPGPGDPFPVGTTTVTYEATDPEGNTTTVSFLVTVTDDEPPTVTVPANITVGTDPSNASAVVTYVVSANDNADGAISPTRTAGLVSGAAFPVGTTTVTYQATDSAGNTTSESFTVTVLDDENPIVTVPGNITVTTDPGSNMAEVNYAVTANDNVDGTMSPILTTGLPSGGNFPLGTTTITYQATDAAGNVGTASFTVTVQDGEVPDITLPADITVNTDPASATAVVTYTATAFDNTDGALTPTRIAGPASGAAFPVGTTTITFEATDSAGNRTEKSFTVTVVDAEPPVVTVPSNSVVTTDPGSNTAIITYPSSATDNVDGAITPTMASGLPSGSAFPVGTTTVTFEATDAAGNKTTESFTVTITDNEAPTVATVPENITVNTDPGLETAAVSYAVPTFVDNVGVESVVRSDGLAPGAAFPVGTTTVTHVATDADGNTVEATFTVTVVDMEAPVITTPANIAVSTDPGSDSAVVTFPLTANDNYGVATLTSSPVTGSSFPIGVTIVTITATDTFGNTSTSTFEVSVTDSEPPTLAGVSADIDVTVDYPLTSAQISFATPTISDNAPGASITQVAGLPSGSQFPIGTTVVTFEGRDASGNIVTVSFNVTVRRAPPGVVTLVVNTGGNDGTFNFASPEPQFNMDIATSGGSGQLAGVSIRPGSYDVVATAPSGFGITSIHCSDSDSIVNASAGSVTINLQSSESVTCTFESVDSRTKTSEAIGNFLRRRNNLLLSSEHDWDRQIDRLARRKTKSGSGTSSNRSSLNSQNFGSRLGEEHGAGTLAAAGFSRKLPGAWNFSGDGGISTSFATSTSQLQDFATTSEQRRVMSLLGEEAYKDLGAEALTAGNKSSDFDIWTEARYTRYDDDNPAGGTSGHFGLVYLGADYIVNPSLLLGVVGQYDDIREASDSDDLTIHGRGWMIGPYATIKLADSLYFQGRAAWGKSQNEISPFNTYTDTFETERWLVRGRLQGRWTHDSWTFSPSASFAYMEERQEAYTDSLNVLIPGQKAALGQAEFGPEVSYTMKFNNGSTLIPSASLKGVWNFAEENATTLDSNSGSKGDIRAKAEAGLRFVGKNGVSFEVTGTYDGIFDEEFEAMSGSVRLHIPFN